MIVHINNIINAFVNVMSRLNVLQISKSTTSNQKKQKIIISKTSNTQLNRLSFSTNLNVYIVSTSQSDLFDFKIS